MVAFMEPYPGMGSAQVMKGVARGTLRPDRFASIPVPLWSLMERMWAQNPVDRPVFEEVLTSLEDMRDRLAERGTLVEETEI